LTEEQRKELYDAIEYEEDRASIVSSIDIPKDVRYTILFFYIEIYSIIILDN
jgi:vacuolar protein sorting-associated protein 13A/C